MTFFSSGQKSSECVWSCGPGGISGGAGFFLGLWGKLDADYHCHEWNVSLS